MRGRGIHQEAFEVLTRKLCQGDWVGIFGEGTRAKQYGTLGEFKPGVGYLLKRAPDTVVVPIGHDGVQSDVVLTFADDRNTCRAYV